MSLVSILRQPETKKGVVEKYLTIHCAEADTFHRFQKRSPPQPDVNDESMTDENDVNSLQHDNNGGNDDDDLSDIVPVQYPLLYVTSYDKRYVSGFKSLDELYSGGERLGITGMHYLNIVAITFCD